MKSEFDGLRIGQTKIVRMDARKSRKACCSCSQDEGVLNVVVHRSGQRTYGSRNYCDACLPKQYKTETKMKTKKDNTANSGLGTPHFRGSKSKHVALLVKAIRKLLKRGEMVYIEK
jgi:hypothetical protein